MNTELYIDNDKVDLLEQSVKYIMQVNDFFNLKSREVSYSSAIDLPKSANNVRLFNYLGYYANSSLTPYRRLNTDFYDDGIAICLNGFGVVRKTTDVYKFHFLDESQDLYKSIEKLSLKDLNYADLAHTKNFESVVNSWENDLNYLYAVADYGGLVEYQNKINIDFLVPSISVSWVWNEIFRLIGKEYEIADGILDNKYFTIANAFKDVSGEGTFDIIAEESKIDRYSSEGLNQVLQKHVAVIEFAETDNPDFTNSGRVFVAPEAGVYEIRYYGDKVFPIAVPIPIYPYLLTKPMPSLDLSINGSDDPLQITSLLGQAKSYEPNENSEGEENPLYEGYSIDAVWAYVVLNAGDEVRLVAYAPYGFIVGLNSQGLFATNPTTIEFIYKPESQIDFSEGLTKLPLKDWFNEILIQNALTPILNKKTGVYRFKTLDERLNAPIVDWSGRGFNILQEDYRVGEYGRRNVFSYKYNNEDENYANGEFVLDNETLKEQNEIQSKFYSAEDEKTLFESLDMQLPFFKMWDENAKETDDGIEFEYKELKNHYHFLEVRELGKNVGLSSKAYGGTTSVTSLKYAEFFPFLWQNIVDNRYGKIKQILNRQSLLEIEIYLTPIEVNQFDLFCRIYIRELGAIYLPNKIIYEPGDLAKVELIKISEYE